MGAARRNIIIEKGATFQLSLIWKDSEGVLVDLTGYVARMQVRKNFNSVTTLLDMDTDNGAITLGGSLGTIDIVGSAEDTSTIDEKVGVYDLELEASDGTVTRLIEGEVTIKPEVTR